MTQPSEKIDLFIAEFIDALIKSSYDADAIRDRGDFACAILHIDLVMQAVAHLCELCGVEGYVNKYSGPIVYDALDRLNELVYGRFEHMRFGVEILYAEFRQTDYESRTLVEHFHFMWKLRVLNEILHDDPAE